MYAQPCLKKSQPAKPAYTEHHSVTGANTRAPAQPRAPQSGDLLTRMGQDLATRLGTPVSAIACARACRPVVWNDSSLGCPQPGTPTCPPTPGVRVVFGYQNKPYQYHGSERGNFVYCEHPAISGLDEK